MFNAANKAFQFSNYKRFKEISDIKKFFVIQKELGKGAFGEVSLATHKNMQMQCALKKISKEKLRENPVYEDLMKDELATLQNVSHGNIMRVFELL